MALEIVEGETRCPACGAQVALPFLDGGMKPLATLAWPQTAEAARALKPLANDFVRCALCGHVYNPAFDYDEVPYAAKPNLMFNRGAGWSHFLGGVREKLAALLGRDPVVVEIGHGDGSFLATLAGLRAGGRFIGFDPHGAGHDPGNGAGNVELRRTLFVPATDLPALKPDLIISRHVLEHLLSPLQFLQQIGYVANRAGLRPAAYFEVPCIDRAIASRRTVDFYYEHSSQFTTQSFTTMLQRAHTGIEELGHGYDGEVIWAVVRFGEGFAPSLIEETAGFRAATAQALETIGRQLAELHKGGGGVALWGGTGKSAAFMCRYDVDVARFPIVVESDRAKVGTFVPGTGRVAGKRLKIGFVSALLREHTILRLNGQLIAALANDEFEVTVIHVSAPDAIADKVLERTTRTVVLPPNLAEARQAIAALEPDALIYTDIGMDAMTHALAFARLAPVQSVMWGHPVTTGIPAIDYFLSPGEAEPDDAERHYSERLIRLSHLPTIYEQPPRAAPGARRRLGLPTESPVLLCPQSLVKLHPDFDQALAGILAGDAAVTIGLISGGDTLAEQKLANRWKWLAPGDHARIRAIPRIARGEFVTLVGECDGMLDPFHFGGGNTTLEAMAVGTPVVTLPGAFMRGRITLACYRHMGLEALIAGSVEEYVGLALQLARERDWRDARRAEILAHNRAVIDNRGIIGELRAFLKAASASARVGRPIEQWRWPDSERGQSK